MESLESKLDRLSPEQRREIEDFVDFLLQRSGTSNAVPSTPAAAPLPLAVVPPPPLPVQEPVLEPASLKLYDLIRRQEPAQGSPQEDPATLLMQEIAAEGDDAMTRDYMDYGQFEQGEKTAAQKKQPRRRNREFDRVADLLEWID